MHIYAEQKFLDNHIRNISESLEIEIISSRPNQESYLAYNSTGLSFIKDAANPKEFLYVDFLKGKLGWRIKRAEHESNLKKAIGKTKKELNIFDATAGFLSDSMIFLSLGHKVMAVEQSKIIFYLVEDAIKRAQSKIPFLRNLSFLNGNSLDIFRYSKESFDAIYLDPMYPKTKKNVKGSGDMRSIRSILKLENILNEENDLCDAFMQCEYQKIILKRPLKYKKIYSNINYQVKGKTTRFDIFI